MGEIYLAKDRFWYSLYRTLIRKNDVKTDAENNQIPDETVIGDTIITARPITMGEFRRRFTKTHIWFAYKFLKPLLIISKKILGRYLCKELIETPYNKNLSIFNRMFDKSLQDWHWYYQLDEEGRKREKYGEYKDPTYGDHEMLRTMKQLVLTEVLADSAYRSFFDMLIFNITSEVNRQYHDQLERDGHISHLLFTRQAINDPLYFKIMGSVDYPIMIKHGDVYYAVPANGATILKDLPPGYIEDLPNIKTAIQATATSTNIGGETK